MWGRGGCLDRHSVIEAVSRDTFVNTRQQAAVWTACQINGSPQGLKP